MATLYIADDVLAEAMKVSPGTPADELVVMALKEFASNHDQRKLIQYLGTFRDDFMMAELKGKEGELYEQH